MEALSAHLSPLGWLRGEDAHQGYKLPTATTGDEGLLAVEREALSTWNMVSICVFIALCVVTQRGHGNGSVRSSYCTGSYVFLHEKHMSMYVADSKLRVMRA